MEERRRSLDEITQWAADQRRLLRAGLQNRDRVTVAGVLEEVSDRLGVEIAVSFFMGTVHRLQEEEGFSFGNPE